VNSDRPPNPLGIDENRLYRVPESAKVLGVNGSTIRRYLGAQVLKGVKVGGHFGPWRIQGFELIRFLNRDKEDIKTFLEYPAGLVKFPHISFILYNMIIGQYQPKRIQEECGKYGLLIPSTSELDQVWESLKITAPKRLKRHMAINSSRVFDLDRDDANSWIGRLGIRDLFGQHRWPCHNILTDQSEKRMHIEIMMCGRVIHKEISDFMAAKYNFIVTEEQLDFFGRHFFNTYNYNANDRILYLGRLENRTEVYYKRRAWGDPVAAKAVLQIPSRVNFEETLNMMAAMAAVTFREFALDGKESIPLAKDASQIVIQSLKQLMALEKLRGEQTATAVQEAQKEGIKTEAFDEPKEEPPSFEDLDQPTEDGKAETKVG